MNIDDDPSLQSDFGEGYKAFMRGVPFAYCPYDLDERMAFLMHIPETVDQLIQMQAGFQPTLDNKWQDWRNGWLRAFEIHVPYGQTD
jgi:hypothetical protein